MKIKLYNKIALGIVLISSSLSTAIFAKDIPSCPLLTAADVEYIIDNGFISTEQGYSLADEAKAPGYEVLRNEPTSNPFDTYYHMYGTRNLANKNYTIYIGNVLGSTSFEAKARTKKILLNSKEIFNGDYNPEHNICFYENINASSSISNYPFKSNYETTVLISAPVGTSETIISKMMATKNN